MEELLTSVNAGQVSDEGSQETGQETAETVNADNGEITTAEQEETATTETAEKPTQTAEENAKFAAIRREAEAKARDKTIADMGMMWKGQPVTTYAEYLKAKEESEAEQIKTALEEKGYDPKVVDEFIENNPTVKKAKELLAEKEKQEKQQKEFAEFFEYFQRENGRAYDASKDTISKEVWEMVNNGKSLTDAYAFQQAKTLKERITDLEAKLKAKETNEANANSTPGSLAGGATPAQEYISPDVFEANRHNLDWVNKNYDRIMKSRAKW